MPRRTPLLRRVDLERLYLAAFGGCLSVLAWLAFGALTALGKFPELTMPMAIPIAVAGALLVLTRLAWVVWCADALALALFCLVAMTPFVTGVLRPASLVRADALPREPLSAVVVLSETITPDSLLGPQALDRLLTGLQLMRDSVANVLVVTEPHRRDTDASAQPDQARVRALVARPFPLVVVDSVHTTRDEALGAWRRLQPQGATRVAVVTSPLHTSRACATFERVGFSVTCVPAISRAYTVRHPLTARDRIALFRGWIYERGAWFEYRHRGWVAGERR